MLKRHTMSWRGIIAFCALAVMASTGAFAQRSPGRAILPWNNYIPSRIPDGFNSIIGQSGTNLISGSSSAYGYNNTFSLPLPMPFYFLGTTYQQGYNLQVSVNGYFSFNGASSTFDTYPGYLYYTTANNYPWYSRYVAVYYSDLQSVGVSGGGIYWRVDGTSPNRTMTIEWRVQGMFYPNANPGNFQARLDEATGKIDMFYGPNSISRTVPSAGFNFGYGAFVGIKNYGQNPGNPATATSDANNQLMMLSPQS
jgi:hypothetical protein